MARPDDPAPVTTETTAPAAKKHSTREDLEHRVEEARAQFDAGVPDAEATPEPPRA
jgi:hypothetical protein